MLMELHDNKPVGEPITAAVIIAKAKLIIGLIASAKAAAAAIENGEEGTDPNTWQKMLAFIYNLSKSDAFKWLAGVVAPGAAERKRFESLLKRFIENNWAKIRDPETLEIIKPEMGIKQLNVLNCLQLRVLEHNLLNHYLPYYSDKSNYRPNTKERVVNRYRAVMLAFIEAVQAKINAKNCPVEDLSDFDNEAVTTGTLDPQKPASASGPYRFGKRRQVIVNGVPVTVIDPIRDGMPSPPPTNETNLIPLGLIALALNL